MGVLAAKIFAQAGASFGLLGKMKLASLARLTSTEASAAEDTPELVGRLEDALRQLRGEEAPAPPGEPTVVAPNPSAGEAATLRRHLSSCVDLLGQRSLFLGDLGATARRITESSATTLDVSRVSVWLLEAEGTRIRCVDLFDRAAGEHAAGTELAAHDYGAYFDALRTERTIAAHDAHVDLRTSCFSAGYLTPLGIGAMLDVPIWRSGTMVGVLCHEHVGGPRRWNSDEETFAYLLASFVALSLERGSADEFAPPAPPSDPSGVLVLDANPSTSASPDGGCQVQRNAIGPTVPRDRDVGAGG